MKLLISSPPFHFALGGSRRAAGLCKAAIRPVCSISGTAAPQRGVALFIALMILVIISVLGVAAMRSSVTNARITTGIQAGVMSFQGAQTAINAVINEMVGTTAGQAGNILTDMISNRATGKVVIQNRCVTAANTAVSAACTTTQFVDSRSLVRASSQSILENDMLPAPGWSLSGAGAYAYNQIIVAGAGAVPTIGITNTNVQELALLGPKPQGDLGL